jgi:hypothetical protein
MPAPKKKTNTRNSPPAKKARNRRAVVRIPFSNKLALNRYILSLFGVDKFEDLVLHLKEESLEGLDENNIHKFYHALTTHFSGLDQLTPEVLLEYDQNIVKHTIKLNEKRIIHGEKPIQWKYFQYISLLFTEIYLDQYFADATSLKQNISQFIDNLNLDREEADQIQGFGNVEDDKEELNKLAFWIATGGGKTLLMHANIFQYKYYLQKYRKSKELNRIILLTPNEGLSQQHLREFNISGIDASIFEKESGELFSGHSIEIIEITKLKDETGDKTVSVDAFEDNNLILIDEGHRGVSTGEQGAWMRYRNALCEKGFSFEYSATFSQAVKGNLSLTGLYSRCILVDYSYRYFYNDGFGKDYQILNLDAETQDHHLEIYLTACLLAFYQQQKLFLSNENSFRIFLIEKPLWVFVGSKVTASLATTDASDIIEILKFLARFIADRQSSINQIDNVLNQGLTTSNGNNLFANRFPFLIDASLQPSEIFDDILDTLFHAPGGGQLYVENLKGAQGEIALRIGADNDPFGVINVGDDVKLVKLCSENGIETGDLEFSGSLFHEINKVDSKVNILIGSKKFTEGWSSWRVSTLGLMNIGRSEGSQIIQLFGRGVRLKGFNYMLKRSSRSSLMDGMNRPQHIQLLETLSIFGIKADYMAQFREFLEEEGLSADEEISEFLLPVIRNLGTQKLKTIRLKKQINGIQTEFGEAFRKLAPIPTLDIPNEYLRKNKVVINWYPKIQAIRSRGIAVYNENVLVNNTHFQTKHIAFLDKEQLYFEMERFKAERGWYNFNLTIESIEKLLTDQSWYEILIPKSELEIGNFEKVFLWQEIALSLLKKYMERYYSFSKRNWEMPYLEYVDLDSNDSNLLMHNSGQESGYSIKIKNSQEEIVEKLLELKEIIVSGNLREWSYPGINLLWYGKHLYKPLVHVDRGVIEVSPTPLNRGEKELIEDLKIFHDSNPQFLDAKELYLLRNLSRGKGVGFFEAGNFHPDFILWLLVGDKQYVTFIDPKGIRNIGLNDPKIQFYQTVKEIESRLGNEDIVLNSFIVSNTPSHEVTNLWGVGKEKIMSCNVVFQEENKDTYISTIFKSMLNINYV